MRRLSRRSLVFGAALAGGVPVTGLLSSCSWVTSEPAATTPTPVATPADVPASETPAPDDTPTEGPEPSPSPTPVPPPEQVLRVAGDLGEAADILRDPERECFDFPSTRAGLLAVNEDLEIEADWAGLWDSVDGGSSWLFRIRENEQGWISGAPVTAHDFVSRWRSLLDPERAHPDSPSLFDIENAREVFSGERPPEDLGAVASDDWTLEVTLERPRQSFPALVAARLMAPRQPSGDDDSPGCDSNGPYYFAGESENTLTLRPHAHYWSSAAATLERIEILTEGPAHAIDSFRNGDIDFARLAPADVPRVRSDIDLRDGLRQGMPTRLVALIPQVDTPPFDDPDIRRALGLMIDRTRLELIVEGRVIPARRLTAEGVFPSLDEAASGLEMSFDVDSGLDLIESSAYPDPVDWPEFSLTIPQGDSYMERIARDLSRQFGENLGIEVPVELISIDAYHEGVRERRFPLTWFEWNCRYADPACVYADLFASFLNPDGPVLWEDDEYDDLVRVADSLDDIDDRAEVYAQCEAMLQDQGVCIPLIHSVDYYLIQQWVGNVPEDSEGRIMQAGPFHSRFVTGLELLRRSR